jgi:hypothetical protein
VTSEPTENEVALVPLLAKGDQIGIETFQLCGALTARQSSFERGWTEASALKPNSQLLSLALKTGTYDG